MARVLLKGGKPVIDTLVMQKKPDFDFEYWRRLAEQDPEAFEAQRRETIDRFMGELPRAEVRDRMERLQWRIDQERARSGSALGACIRLYKMMWRSAAQNYDLIQSLNVPAEQAPTDDSILSKAEVLEFPDRTGTGD